MSKREKFEEDAAVEGINPFRFDFEIPWYRYIQVKLLTKIYFYFFTNNFCHHIHKINFRSLFRALPWFLFVLFQQYFMLVFFI